MTSYFPLVLAAPWIVISDIKSRLIPNKALLMLWSLIVASQFSLKWSQQLSIYEFGCSLFVIGLVFYFLSSHSIGMGDIKLLALSGLMLNQLQRILEALTYAAVIGLIWAIATRKNSIPFAPPLIVGVLMVMTGLQIGE